MTGALKTTLLTVMAVALLSGGVALTTVGSADASVHEGVAAPLDDRAERSETADETRGKALDRRIERGPECHEGRQERVEAWVGRRLERRERVAGFLRDVAVELGLEPDEVHDAVVAVASERLDAAVADGRVSEATADELRAALGSGDGDRIRAAVRQLIQERRAGR